MYPRRLSTAAIAFAAVISCVFAQASSVVPVTSVRGVESTPVAALVILDGGYDSGLRPGMVCRVVRNGVQVADLVLVDLRSAHSTAVLLTVSSGQSVRPGDVALVKTFKS